MLDSLLFLSNNNIIRRSCGFVLGLYSNGFYKNVLIKGPGSSTKPKPQNLLLTLWFDEKVYLMYIYLKRKVAR